MIKSTVALVALSGVAFAQNLVTIYNYCGQEKYAHVSSSAFDYVSGLLATDGGSYAVELPALSSSWIAFGESGECPGQDGPGCTRLECDFSNPEYQQCDLSEVAGYSIPLAFSWSDASCTGADCEGVDYNADECWNTEDPDNGGSLRQCDTANVGVNLYLCGA